VEPTYNQKQQAARARLRAAFHPAMADEHRIVDWLLSNLTPNEADVWSEMVERRTRTAARAARMGVAQQTRDYWKPAAGSPVDIVAKFEHYAKGGDPVAGAEPEQMAAAAADYQRGFNAGVEHAAGVENYEDVRTAVGLAYDKGFTEGIAHAREQQLRGIAPELWQTR
jgi:hypothetical protein